MRATYYALTMLFMFSLPASAIPCNVDGQCGYGKRCIMAVGEQVGQCVGIKDKFGNMDRYSVGTAGEAKAADNKVGGRSRCNWDSDCGQGNRCHRAKPEDASGMCVR